MRRLVVPDVRIEEGGLIELDEASCRHLTTVLRMREGDRVLILDGRGRAAEGPLLRTEDGQLAVSIESMPPCPRTESPTRIVLAQSVIKGGRMDWVVEKATELGVTEIWPFLSERSVPGWQVVDRGKPDRWQRIAIQAARQSGRAVVPVIREIMTFDNMIDFARATAGLKVVFWEEEAQSVDVLTSPAAELVAAVGPEGSFSVGEVRELVRAGFVASSLGPRILRAETAAVVAVAVLQHRFGDLGSGPEGLL